MLQAPLSATLTILCLTQDAKIRDGVRHVAATDAVLPLHRRPLGGPMTIFTMVWALKQAPVPPNDPVAHLVLIAYADHANDDGTAAWPSVATVARYARCTPRTVHTKLRVLIDHGLMRPGDQQLVDHLPANRRPVVYDLCLDASIDHARGANRPAADESDDKTAGQAGVKILHPKNKGSEALPVENPDPGVKPVSPQEPAAVDNSAAGVNAASPQPVDNGDRGVNSASPQDPAWGEAERTSGVKLSSYKPPLEPPVKNQGLRESGTSPGVIHRPPRPDRCQNHQDSVVPVPCLDCAAARRAHDAAPPEPSECPHGTPRGPDYCALCRQGFIPGLAPWDAEPPRDLLRPG